MNTKFFTNQDTNTLLNKIEGIFKYKSIYFFDALVGYFYASGYFRIRPYIEKSQNIRILVGIDVDNLIRKANYEGLQFSEDKTKSKESFLKELEKNIQSAKYSKEVENGILQLIEDLVDNKIEIRIHPKKNIHAKIYIFKEEHKHDHGYGVVITGSSNLTGAGLEKNFEFNVELRDNADIDFASETFEELWEESVELDLNEVVELKKKTFLNDTFTPFQIYFKFLMEYFGSSIDYDPNSVSDLPKGYKRLAYQVDAVNDGFNKLKKHNGFFLADVVGLGKTMVATIIAKKYFFYNDFPSYRSNSLIITPPAIESNWRETVELFDLDNVKIVRNGSLAKIKNPEKYDLIIVDEAHKFRNDSSDMYKNLQIISKSPTKRRLPNGEFAPKKIILVTATPLNNRPEDIANQIYLFQDSKNTTLEISNLQSFFAKHIEAYKKITVAIKNGAIDTKELKEKIKKIYDDIRNKVLNQIIVRRTRTDLKEHEQYSKDLEQQGIKFPDVGVPNKILYELDDELDDLYDYTMETLKGEENGFRYNRYKAIGALLPAKRIKYRFATHISELLAKLMKTLLVKRIDSSFFAFKKSIHRFLDANSSMIKMFENNRIYIAPNIDVNDYILDDKIEELELEITKRIDTDPTILICEASDFEDGFYDGLIKDQKILEELVAKWDKIKQDPKLDKFTDMLNNGLFDEKINLNHKLVVFSESKETTEYLFAQLKKVGVKKVLSIDSSNRKEQFNLIRANFDQNIPEKQKQNDYDLILTTEVLAEGVNLHRANVIVNYDTPWNSTRLMQRIGRINRIGTEADKIHVFNFYPTSKVDSDIALKNRAIMKLQAFHSALGEDSQIYSDVEEIETFGLFDKEFEDERDERLNYLMKLRKFKEETPEEFKKIKNMPLRARVGRKNDGVENESTVCFIKNNKRDAFYFAKENGELDELTFVDTAKIFEAYSNEKGFPLHNKHHEQVNSALEDFSDKIDEEKTFIQTAGHTQAPNERKAFSFLDAFANIDIAGKEDKEKIQLAKEAIRKGTFQNLHRDINKLEKSLKNKKMKPIVILEKLIEIIDKHRLHTKQRINNFDRQAEINFNELNPEIIISESFENR